MMQDASGPDDAGSGRSAAAAAIDVETVYPYAL
jgi:hypothetical protein